MQCALAPILCRIGAQADVQAALRAEEGMSSELLDALLRHSTETTQALTVMTGRSIPADQLTRDTIRQCFDDEALAFLYTCAQAEAGEVLQALTRLTFAPSPAGLALLLGEQRRQAAMLEYGLQLMWRILADASIPDPMSLFGRQQPARSAQDIRRSLIRQLKGGGQND